MLFEVIADILQIRCSGGVQRMRIYERNISSQRASLSSSSLNRPGSLGDTFTHNGTKAGDLLKQT
jgi:hypothetical protein